MPTIRKTHEKSIRMASELVKTLPFGKMYFKLQAISALSRENIKKVSEVFGVTDDTLKSWVKSFTRQGTVGLEAKAKKPRTPKLNENHKNQIKLWLEQNPNLTINAVKIRVKEEFMVEISVNGLWKNIKKLGLSHITPRSKHYKQNTDEVNKFKALIGEKNKK